MDPVEEAGEDIERLDIDSADREQILKQALDEQHNLASYNERLAMYDEMVKNSAAGVDKPGVFPSNKK